MILRIRIDLRTVLTTTFLLRLHKTTIATEATIVNNNSVLNRLLVIIIITKTIAVLPMLATPTVNSISLALRILHIMTAIVNIPRKNIAVSLLTILINPNHLFAHTMHPIRVRITRIIPLLVKHRVTGVHTVNDTDIPGRDARSTHTMFVTTRDHRQIKPLRHQLTALCLHRRRLQILLQLSSTAVTVRKTGQEDDERRDIVFL
jgi:hypothetical protein